jgi:tripartite-type tricarboxylate transporter receptor subunit TctC
MHSFEAGITRRAALAAGFGLSGALCFDGSGLADGEDRFFQGRTISLVIGAGVGGFYDIHARLIASFLPKYVPFHPSVIPQNMPGASQLRATEYAYRIAPRDGSVLLVVQPYVILDRLLDDRLGFDIARMSWIGRVGSLGMAGIVSRVSGVRTIEDARNRQVMMGGDSPTGPAAMIPWALNRLAGTRFHVVRGYPDQSDEQLAMDRGEIQGIGNGSLSDFAQMKTPYEVLYLSSTKRSASLPNVPTIDELVVHEADRPVMDILASASDVGLTLAGPPQIPAARLKALRRGFEQMCGDPEYRSALAKLSFQLEFMSGSKLASFVTEHFTPPETLRARLREATAPQA